MIQKIIFIIAMCNTGTHCDHKLTNIKIVGKPHLNFLIFYIDDSPTRCIMENVKIIIVFSKISINFTLSLQSAFPSHSMASSIRVYQRRERKLNNN